MWGVVGGVAERARADAGAAEAAATAEAMVAAVTEVATAGAEVATALLLPCRNPAGVARMASARVAAGRARAAVEKARAAAEAARAVAAAAAEEEEEEGEGERAQLDLAMLWRGVRISRRWMVDAAQGRPGFGSAVLSSGRHVRGARHAVCDVHDTFEFDSFGRGAGGSCLHQSMAMTWQRHDSDTTIDVTRAKRRAKPKRRV